MSSNLTSPTIPHFTMAPRFSPPDAGQPAPGPSVLISWQWRRLRWAVVIVGLITLASSRSRVASPDLTEFDDKIAHFAVYAFVATLVTRAGPGWRAAGWAILGVSIFGALDEWHQAHVPGRSSSVADWVADTLGAVAGASLYAGWPAYRKLLERRVPSSKQAGAERPREPT